MRITIQGKTRLNVETGKGGDLVTVEGNEVNSQTPEAVVAAFEETKNYLEAADKLKTIAPVKKTAIKKKEK